MTEEEKKAVEIIKGLAVYYDDYSLLDEEEIEENESVNKSIELILNLIEKLQKENEKLKENNMEYKRILDLADNRIYRKKYLEERRKEELNLLYPDSDEIYQRYYELKQENEKLKNKLLDTLEGQKVIEEETPQYIKENYILKEKVKDKIEELKNISNAEELEDIMNRKNYTISELVQYVLQELLEGRKI